jgi:predicted hotdog family 3-hydroxylacyl-ACP dehydratase
MDKNINIEDLIPQRHPFILLDQLISCNDKLIESSFQIPENHSMVTNGKLCEGGLIENIAQTAAAGNGYEAKEKGLDIPKGFIAGIKNLWIKRLPLVNSNLKTKVIQQDRIMGFNLIKGEVLEGEEIIVSCEMKIYCPV